MAVVRLNISRFLVGRSRRDRSLGRLYVVVSMFLLAGASTPQGGLHFKSSGKLSEADGGYKKTCVDILREPLKNGHHDDPCLADDAKVGGVPEQWQKQHQDTTGARDDIRGGKRQKVDGDDESAPECLQVEGQEMKAKTAERPPSEANVMETTQTLLVQPQPLRAGVAPRVLLNWDDEERCNAQFDAERWSTIAHIKKGDDDATRTSANDDSEKFLREHEEEAKYGESLEFDPEAEQSSEDPLSVFGQAHIGKGSFPLRRPLNRSPTRRIEEVGLGFSAPASSPSHQMRQKIVPLTREARGKQRVQHTTLQPSAQVHESNMAFLKKLDETKIKPASKKQEHSTKRLSEEKKSGPAYFVSAFSMENTNPRKKQHRNPVPSKDTLSEAFLEALKDLEEGGDEVGEKKERSVRQSMR
ncbi:unnamed protein product [Amoebophrya sp. A25]|nr:unnamed protein product [Amoebophrya sp. A25]|eukprot:GSA25T00010943001.1